MAAFFKSRKAIFAVSVLIFVILVAVFFTVFSKRNDNKGPTDDLVVTTKYGKLRGSIEITEDAGKHIKYFAFKGVPYAQPPVKELRFKGPKPLEKWTGIRDATVLGNICTQAGFGGSEDCLYLNVYTPKLPSDKANPKYAVYVFIHGGVWQYGSGGTNEFGPEFILTQDVVVVTMNYRMGVLASLCLDTDEIPGNVGLKDQLQVLRWVNENIAAFGGDPTKVTVGGQSSGGVSASWLTILPQTKSLVRFATLQSGNALSGVMALNYKYKEFADAIYTHLTGRSGDSKTEMTSVFHKASYLDLYYAAENATLLLQATKGLGTDMSFFYYPNIENRQEGKEEILIRKDAESYFISKEANDIPIILGETKQEWTLFYSRTPMFNNDTLLEEGIKNLITYVPESIVPKSDTQKLLGIEDVVSKLDISMIVDEIRDHFFNDPALPTDCNTNCRMTKYMHQVYMMADASHMLRVRSKYLTSPTYAYQFNLESDWNVKSENLPDYLKNDVVHGDDMSYIWRRTRKAQSYYGTSTGSMALRRQVALFTNFIKHGNPTPKVDDLITTTWTPVLNGDDESFLEITETLTQQTGSMAGPDGAFWKKIFQSCRGDKSP